MRVSPPTRAASHNPCSAPLLTDEPEKAAEQAWTAAAQERLKLQLQIVEQTIPQQRRDELRPPVVSRWWESNRWWDDPSDSDSDSDLDDLDDVEPGATSQADLPLDADAQVEAHCRHASTPGLSLPLPAPPVVWTPQSPQPQQGPAWPQQPQPPLPLQDDGPGNLQSPKGQCCGHPE